MFSVFVQSVNAKTEDINKVSPLVLVAARKETILCFILKLKIYLCYI